MQGLESKKPEIYLFAVIVALALFLLRSRFIGLEAGNFKNIFYGITFIAVGFFWFRFFTDYKEHLYFKINTWKSLVFLGVNLFFILFFIDFIFQF